MAPQTSSNIIERILTIFDSKFDTYAAVIASDLPTIKEFLPCPLEAEQCVGFPTLCCFFDESEIEDAPQEAGASEYHTYKLDAFLELLRWSRDTAPAVHDFKDAMKWTMKNEQELLHPSTGSKLAWLPKYAAWPMGAQIRWWPYSGSSGGIIQVSLKVRVTVDEAESY